MAIQPPHKKQPGAQINRTPAPRRKAPDVVSSIRETSGQSGYGQSASPLGNSKVALPPGVGGPQTLLGQNLLDSVDDPVAAEVLAHGVAGRGDSIPADEGDDYQLRKVSAEMYPIAAGGSMKRQQNPDAVFGKASALPSAETDNETEPVRKPV